MEGGKEVGREGGEKREKEGGRKREVRTSSYQGANIV